MSASQAAGAGVLSEPMDPLNRIATIPELLAARVAAQADDEGLVIDGRRLTWREVAAATARVAGGLHGLGVRAGDHIGICMGNSVEWVLTWFAAAHLGAAIVALNTRWKDDESAWAVDYADVKVLVFAGRLLSADLLGMAARTRPAFPKVAHWVMVDADADAHTKDQRGHPRHPEWALPFASLDGVPPPSAALPSSTTLIQFTSGSTARPKGVMLTQAGMLANARGSAGALGLRRGDRYFSRRPFFHVAGSTGGILRTLATGACLISTPTFDDASALDLLRREGCQLVAGNDAMFLKMLASLDADGGGTAGLKLRGGQAAAGQPAARPPRGGRGPGGGVARRPARRCARRLRRAEARRDGHARGPDQMEPAAHRQLQGAAPDRHRRQLRRCHDRQRQAAEKPVARAGR